MGTKYPKFKSHSAAFLEDIGKAIDTGKVTLVGKGTLKVGDVPMNIYRGNGVTIVTKANGEFVTILRSGQGLDLGITLIP